MRTALLVPVVLALLALPPLGRLWLARRLPPPRLRPAPDDPVQRVRQDFRLSTGDYVSVERAALTGAAAPGPLRRPAARLARDLLNQDKPPLAGRARLVAIGSASIATLAGLAWFIVLLRDPAQRRATIPGMSFWLVYLSLIIWWTWHSRRRRRGNLTRAITLNGSDPQ